VIQNNAPTSHDVVHWQTGEGKRSNWAVRSGDWKLLGNPRDPQREETLTEADSLFLVNLADDITEMKNSASEYPMKVKNLLKLHDDWVKKIVEDGFRQ
jgi:arylsulfatase A